MPSHIPAPDTFTSARHPSRKIFYRRLGGPDAKHTLLFCYGAGSHSALITLFNPFLDQHPDLEMLCVDRWVLPVPPATSSSFPVSRSGLSIFGELTEITIELLQSLNISKLSIAAHSAGVYQMLHLAQNCQDIPTLSVTHLFPLCTAIPASFCGSKFLTRMCVMPELLFKTLTRVDSSFGETWLGSWMAGTNPKSIATAQLRRELSNYKALADESSARSERQDLDYCIIYERLEGIDHEQLVNMYSVLTTLASTTKVVWFTSERDAFFGPSSVSHLLQEGRLEKNWAQPWSGGELLIWNARQLQDELDLCGLSKDVRHHVYPWSPARSSLAVKKSRTIAILDKYLSGGAIRLLTTGCTPRMKQNPYLVSWNGNWIQILVAVRFYIASWTVLHTFYTGQHAEVCGASYLNETFPDGWFRIPHSYSLVDLLGDISELFLFKPQPLGRNYEGRFVPLNISIPNAPADIGCLGASLLASAAPDEAEPVVQAVNALKDQIFSKVLGSAACDISQYEQNGGNPYYTAPAEDVNGGSGSGITHKGEWDSQTVKPSGASSGQPVKRSTKGRVFSA